MQSEQIGEKSISLQTSPLWHECPEKLSLALGEDKMRKDSTWLFSERDSRPSMSLCCHCYSFSAFAASPLIPLELAPLALGDWRETSVLSSTATW